MNKNVAMIVGIGVKKQDVRENNRLLESEPLRDSHRVVKATKKHP